LKHAINNKTAKKDQRKENILRKKITIRETKHEKDFKKGDKSSVSALRLQNSRIFCERGRPSICERKAVWSECENGEGEWGETPCLCPLEGL